MRPIAQFRHMMALTVQVAPLVSRDRNSVPTYGDPVTYQAKVYYIRRMVTDASRSTSAEQIIPQRVIHLDSADPILPTAQLTLTTGDVGSTETWAIHPLIRGVERLYDERGAHSTILHLQ